MVITFDKMLGARYQKPLAENASYIDFNSLVGNRHSNFLNMEGRDNINPDCHKYYDLVLHGNSPDLLDTTLFAKNQKGGGFRLR